MKRKNFYWFGKLVLLWMAEHIQRDWEDKLYTERLTTQIKRIVDFLNHFGTNQKQTLLQSHICFIYKRCCF